MEKIFILGAGGLAKEIHFLLRQIGGYEIIAFIDKVDSESIKVGNMVTPVINEDKLVKFKGANLAFGIGDPKIILRLAEKFSTDYNFPNLIHPNVIADWNGVKIGMGNIISSGVNLTTGLTIGNFNIMNINCTIGHDTNIGHGNVFNPGCNIAGGVHIGNGILVGINSTILQYKSIGDNSIVGASSLVILNIKPNTTVFGVPAKILIKK
jgi:sugar O-acyltransferase (sialic acid O-acetyltransferase NeuD family)